MSIRNASQWNNTGAVSKSPGEDEGRIADAGPRAGHLGFVLKVGFLFSWEFERKTRESFKSNQRPAAEASFHVDRKRVRWYIFDVAEIR